MTRVLITFILVLILSHNGFAGELPALDDPAMAAPRADTAAQPPDVNNPEDTKPTEEQRKAPESAYFGKKSDRPVSAHKVNYFALNHWPGENDAQIKFQISMKFRVLEPNLYILKYNLFPAYFAYTQKSLWNEGQESMPFEESNYNPEFFLDYPVNAAIIGRLRLRNVLLSPLEHESNGLDGVRSRSWNRQYVLIKFGFEAREKLDITNSFLSD